MRATGWALGCLLAGTVLAKGSSKYADDFEHLPTLFPDTLEGDGEFGFELTADPSGDVLNPPTYAVTLEPVPGLDAVREIPLADGKFTRHPSP